MATYGSGHVPERWVLVVHDDTANDDISIEVDHDVWERYEVGNQNSA